MREFVEFGDRFFLFLFSLWPKGWEGGGSPDFATKDCFKQAKHKKANKVQNRLGRGVLGRYRYETRDRNSQTSENMIVWFAARYLGA